MTQRSTTQSLRNFIFMNSAVPIDTHVRTTWGIATTHPHCSLDIKMSMGVAALQIN